MNHYAMASACTPSRASLFTGQYPSLHGVTQTTGVAKEPFEDDQFWLDPDTVPTMGDYFRAAGYNTFYKGKWHVSDPDMLIPDTHDQLLSFDDDGNPIAEKEQIYLDAERLDGFGFTGWIGPEPHCKNPPNSGSSPAKGKTGRDAGFANQTVALLQQLQANSRTRPWLVVSSFVNAHDITLWGDLTLQEPDQYNLRGQLKGTTVPDALFDPLMYKQTSTESLKSKPTCQQSYVDTYPLMLQPTENNLPYHKCAAECDGDIQMVLDQLRADKIVYENTIVIFSSDQGELLGAHGGMHQKWHQAYEEAVHIPFILHNPKLFSGRQSVDLISSHADLLPTMLGLAGLDPVSLQQMLAQTHDEVHPLVGSRPVRGDPWPGRPLHHQRPRVLHDR